MHHTVGSRAGRSPTRALLVEDAYKSNMFAAPEADALGLGTASTPSGAPYFSIIIGHGAKVDGSQWRNTAIGALAFTAFQSGDRNEAFGQGAMRFAVMGSNNTAIGSLSHQWIGIQSAAALTAATHDLYDPKAPSDVAWDALGFETANPGIRAKIVAAQTFAATKADVSGNVGLGRNTNLDLVTGSYNTAIGYNALAHVLYASSNVAMGYGALRDNMLGSYNTAIGTQAGLEHQEGNINVYVGYLAGEEHVSGLGNVMIGPAAGAGFTTGNRNVIIGYGAGTGVTAGSDLLVVQNLSSRAPLISGDFANVRVGVGDILPASLYGTFHVRVAASGGVNANAAARTLILESTGNFGMSFVGAANSIQSIYFSDPDDNNVGGVLYNHSTDQLLLRAYDGATKLALGNGIAFFGGTVTAKQTVTGSRGSNAALASLLTALANYGLITNSSS